MKLVSRILTSLKSQVKKPTISKENLEKITKNIIYKDDNLIVINKISGIATQGEIKY